MATRSTIALEFADGTVEQVYCHWDGYLDNNGKILLAHWSDPFKLQKLIDLGNLSSLAPELGSRHDFDSSPKGECNFYGRDRGDTDFVNKAKFKDFADYKANHDEQEYEYILRTDGKWYVKSYDSDYVELSEAIKAEEAADAAVE